MPYDPSDWTGGGGERWSPERVQAWLAAQSERRTGPRWRREPARCERKVEAKR
jgi:hypothetical protein